MSDHLLGRPTRESALKSVAVSSLPCWTAAQDDIGISEYLVFHQNALVRRVPGDNIE